VRTPQKVTLLSLFQSNRQLVVYADEIVTAFLEPQRAIDKFAVSLHIVTTRAETSTPKKS
jgi:hypothetical protein